MSEQVRNTKFYNQIIDLLQKSKDTVVRSVNQTRVLTYFEVGRLIVEEEQKGKERAGYGKEILKELSKVLVNEFGRGFSVTNLSQMRSFYVIYQKRQTLSDEFRNIDNQGYKTGDVRQNTLLDHFNLSWSHYLTLMQIDVENERIFYEIEAFKRMNCDKRLQPKSIAL